uniref:Rz-like spanin n=1 Tax=Salmonella phage vB_SEnST11_KE22 TaxID=3161173 RepID=A0AAU8GFK6_9CAUD
MCVEVQCARRHGRQELLNATNQLGAARSRQNMKKLCLLLALSFALTGCDIGQKRDNLKEYAWAIEFCGDKSQVYSFKAFEALSSYVDCKDGRSAIVPNFYK